MILPLLEEVQDRGVAVYLSTFESVSITLNNLIVDEDNRKEGEYHIFFDSLRWSKSCRGKFGSSTSSEWD
ncbi:hypothetical protein [Erysipelothrix aquatica]|uniref:hypothetical protein n=1 Tax=Erysipelothrix aquatica TaxID=2683714 RepID=UPI0013585485|nr:hypothetical protein [Erysipelothrix aquatica]